MTDTDIRFYFDPVCPFAWMTSKWVRMVAAQRDYAVDWRFISLRMINSGIDYGSHFPAGYEEGHTSGLRLLRVAARARAEHGRTAAGSFYEAVSSEIFDSPGAAGLTPATRGSRAFVEPLLARAGLPAGLAGALDDTRWDDEIRAEGDEALALTGRDVGTPIIHFSPPAGAAFFGPVISGHLTIGGATGSRAGRLADSPSPEEVPCRRRLIHGPRYCLAQRASSRRAASQTALVTASTAVWGGSAASGARQSSVTGTPSTSHARSATRWCDSAVRCSRSGDHAPADRRNRIDHRSTR